MSGAGDTDGGRLSPSTIDGLLNEANYLFVLYRDRDALTRGRNAIRRIIEGARAKKKTRR